MDNRDIFERKYVEKSGVKSIKFNHKAGLYEASVSAECISVDLINAYWKIWQDATRTVKNSKRRENEH